MSRSAFEGRLRNTVEMEHHLRVREFFDTVETFWAERLGEFDASANVSPTVVAQVVAPAANVADRR
jgi:hypothetical protein